jgi:hypothetical protein
MTNAHVVAGAQRIRVVLPVAPTALFDVFWNPERTCRSARLRGNS